MVQPIENEARIHGAVRRVHPHDSENHVDLVVEVEAVEDVGARPNLLADRLGQELTVTIEADHIAKLGLAPDDRVVIDAELRGPGAVWARPGGVKRA